MLRPCGEFESDFNMRRTTPQPIDSPLSLSPYNALRCAPGGRCKRPSPLIQILLSWDYVDDEFEISVSESVLDGLFRAESDHRVFLHHLARVRWSRL